MLSQNPQKISFCWWCLPNSSLCRINTLGRKKINHYYSYPNLSSVHIKCSYPPRSPANKRMNAIVSSILFHRGSIPTLILSSPILDICFCPFFFLHSSSLHLISLLTISLPSHLYFLSSIVEKRICFPHCIFSILACSLHLFSYLLSYLISYILYHLFSSLTYVAEKRIYSHLF